MTLNRPDRVPEHNFMLGAEVQLAIDEGQDIWIPASSRGLPDLYIDQKPRDVKTLDATKRVALSQRQYDDFARRFETFQWSLWKADEGRRLMSSVELLERAERYRGEVLRPGVNGRGPFYLIDLSSDVLDNPFSQLKLPVPPERDDLPSELQMDIYGRVTTREDSTWRSSPQQAALFHYLAMRGHLTAMEVGRWLHAWRGCPPGKDRPDRDHKRVYAGAACCRRAVDDGASFICELRDAGRVWKDDESGMWLLYPEPQTLAAV